MPTSFTLSINSFKKIKGKGFTLVELMVVITILAILATATIGIFNGAQGNARDARRLLEVNGLAKNIESTRDASGNYNYDAAKFAADYGTTALVDPDGKPYCVYMKASAITAPSANPTGTVDVTNLTCPKATAVATKTAAASDDFVNVSAAGLATAVTNKYFMVCSARSERGTKPFCQTQFTK